MKYRVSVFSETWGIWMPVITTEDREIAHDEVMYHEDRGRIAMVEKVEDEYEGS
jgi:hypothetical protein